MKYLKSFFENYSINKKFIIEENKFKLFIDNNLVAETSYNIEESDEFFNEKYISIYDLETFEQFRGKGYARLLLEEIFKYTKDKLKIKIITLIVDKDNYKAVNLYLKTGFEIFIEYEYSYSLVKYL